MSLHDVRRSRDKFLLNHADRHYRLYKGRTAAALLRDKAVRRSGETKESSPMSDQDTNVPEGSEPSSKRTTLLCPCCGSQLALAAGNGSSHLVADEVSASVPAGTMFIDPHAHMISRTTDDYVA